MRVVIVFKEDSSHGRDVLDFLHDFEHQTGHVIDTLNPDELEGEQFCRAYDIVEYPTVIAIADDSSMQNMWRGLPLPTINEVAYYYA